METAQGIVSYNGCIGDRSLHFMSHLFQDEDRWFKVFYHLSAWSLDGAPVIRISESSDTDHWLMTNDVKWGSSSCLLWTNDKDKQAHGDAIIHNDGTVTVSRAEYFLFTGYVTHETLSKQHLGPLQSIRMLCVVNHITNAYRAQILRKMDTKCLNYQKEMKKEQKKQKKVIFIARRVI